MPRRSKISHLPDELQEWLRGELRSRGFAEYDAVTEALNRKLAEHGLLVSISRTAVANFSSEHREFLRLQQEASSWAAGWLDEAGLEEEASRQSVLFKMITTVAFKVMKAQMTHDADDIDPRDLHFLGRMMKDVMASSGIREAITEKERQRLISEERKSAAERAVSATRTAGVPLTREVAAAIRAAVEGKGEGKGEDKSHEVPSAAPGDA